MNPLDWKIADGIYEGRRPHVFPLVLGVDAAGTVEFSGSQGFRAGERVAGQFLHDPVGTGTYAEFATVPERMGIAVIPDSMPSAAAAALPTAGMTALESIEALGLATGQSLLIVGASGGVGSFATELASHQGVRVLAVARSGSATRLGELGAEGIIDPTQADVTAAVLRVYPAGVDGLLDVMSDRAGFARWAGLVRRGGVAVSTTFSADPESLSRTGVRAVNIDLHPTAPLLERLIRTVAEQHLPVPVEQTVSLTEAPSALAELKAGRGHGKTVVEVRP